MDRAGQEGRFPGLTAHELQTGVERIAAIGNRFAGSDGERRARELVLSELSGVAGLDGVRAEPLQTLAYRPGTATCRLPGAPSVELPAVGLQSTRSGDVEAPATYLGRPATIDDIRELEAAGARIVGRIAVIHSFWPFAFCDYLAQRGAAGLIVIGENPDGHVGHYVAQLYPHPPAPDFPGRPMDIPGVTLERSAGDRLLALLFAGRERVRIRHDCRYEVIDTANAVGVLRGRERPHEWVVLGAHYDTQLEGVGACDNATGLAGVLVTARRWADARPRRSVAFVAFADEEHGFLGSTAYCRRHRDRLASTVGMVNLDALAWAFPAKRSIHADPSIADLVADRAARRGWAADEILDASHMTASDHNPFIDAGVPACWLWRYPPQHLYYHSAGDTLDALDFDLVADTADAATYVAWCLAEEPEIEPRSATPAKRWMSFDAG